MYPVGLLDSSILLKVIDILEVKVQTGRHHKLLYDDKNNNKESIFFPHYLLEGTAGTQCLATSAPFPVNTRTDLIQN